MKNEGIDFKRNNFNAIRLLAAFMVMSGHMAYLIGINRPILFEQEIQSLGCKLFFIIGGYLITESIVRDDNLIRYIVKRLARIFPALVICIMFSVFVFGPILSTLSFHDYFSNIGTYRYLKNIGLCIEYFLPGVFQNNPYPNAVNGSLWTLPIEFFMYFVIPAIYLILEKMGDGLKKYFLFMIVSLVCTGQIYHLRYVPEARYVFYNTDVFQAMDLIPFYIIGMLYSICDIKKYLNIQYAFVMVFLFSCLHLGLVANLVISYILVPYIVLSFALEPCPKLYDVLKNFDISYGIYLYSFLVQQMVVYFMMLLGCELSFFRCLFISFIITVAIAMLSERFVEKPAQDYAKKVLKKL